jgi:hypothetical protein
MITMPCTLGNLIVTDIGLSPSAFGHTAVAAVIATGLQFHRQLHDLKGVSDRPLAPELAALAVQ